MESEFRFLPDEPYLVSWRNGILWFTHSSLTEEQELELNNTLMTDYDRAMFCFSHHVASDMGDCKRADTVGYSINGGETIPYSDAK
jgi:hypothetical protein